MFYCKWWNLVGNVLREGRKREGSINYYRESVGEYLDDFCNIHRITRWFIQSDMVNCKLKPKPSCLWFLIFQFSYFLWATVTRKIISFSPRHFIDNNSWSGLIVITLFDNELGPSNVYVLYLRHTVLHIYDSCVRASGGVFTCNSCRFLMAIGGDPAKSSRVSSRHEEVGSFDDSKISGRSHSCPPRNRHTLLFDPLAPFQRLLVPGVETTFWAWRVFPGLR